MLSGFSLTVRTGAAVNCLFLVETRSVFAVQAWFVIHRYWLPCWGFRGKQAEHILQCWGLG